MYTSKVNTISNSSVVTITSYYLKNKNKQITITIQKYTMPFMPYCTYYMENI